MFYNERNRKIKKKQIKQHRDQFFKKSKSLGYRSRASFELIELNKKFKFIKKNANLLDLVMSRQLVASYSKLISNGKILAIDIKNMEPVANIKFLNCDIFDKNTKSQIIDYFKGDLDVIILDMAAMLQKQILFHKNKSVVF